MAHAPDYALHDCVVGHWRTNLQSDDTARTFRHCRSSEDAAVATTSCRVGSDGVDVVAIVRHRASLIRGR